MSISSLARQLARRVSQDNSSSSMNIIDFIEDEHGLGFRKDLGGMGLYPVQRFVLKMAYGIPLDENRRNVEVPKSWNVAGSAKRGEHYYSFTETEYLRYLHEEGRCNLGEQDLTRNLRELVMPVGRRSGKSLTSGMIAAYETYRLIRRHNPQAYYGMPPHAGIQICSIAPSKDQAGLLFNEVKRHYNGSRFFQTYVSRNTQSNFKFQTPYDIEQTGHIQQGARQASDSINVTFYSANASGLRGHANIVVILDEFAFFVAKGKSSDEAVYQAVTPSTATFFPKDPTDYERGIGPLESRIVMISSPYARQGLFYETAMQALSGNRKQTLLVQAPTWEVNPTIGREALEADAEKDFDKFMCEYGARFSDSVKSWIEDPKLIYPCLDPGHRPVPRGLPREPHFLGMDLAAKGDGTAVTLTHVVDDKVEIAYHEEWRAGVAWEELNPHLVEVSGAPFRRYAGSLEHVDVLDFQEIADWVEDLFMRFYIEKGILDQWGATAFIQELQRRNITDVTAHRFTAVQSSDMYDTFRQLMLNRQLTLYNFPCKENADGNEDHYAPYIGELLELQAYKKSKSVVTVEAPPVLGKHDDFSDSLIRSVFLANEAMARGQGGVRQHGYRAQVQEHLPKAHTIRDAQQYYRQRRRHNNYQSKRVAPRGKKR